MKLKKLLSLSLISTLIFSSNIYANSNESLKKEYNLEVFGKQKLIDEISEKYNLKDINVNELPEGIVPLEVNVNNLENEILNFENYLDNQSDIKENFNISKSRSEIREKLNKKNISGFFSVDLSTTITKNNNKIINATTPSVTVNGFTLAVDVSNISTSKRIYDSNKKIDVEATYQIDYYLVIEGGIKLCSINRTTGFTWEINKGFISSYDY